MISNLKGSDVGSIYGWMLSKFVKLCASRTMMYFLNEMRLCIFSRPHEYGIYSILGNKSAMDKGMTRLMLRSHDYNQPVHLLKTL